MPRISIKQENPEPRPLKKVTLELSEEEAQYLVNLTGSIGGTNEALNGLSKMYLSTPEKFTAGFRKYNDAVYYALENAGIKYNL